MRLLVAFMCLLAGCLAQKPQPCASPALLTGAFTVATQNEKLWIYCTYEYDALGQRIRLRQQGTYQTKPFTNDFLLLFREGAVYQIFDTNRTCIKSALKDKFHPMEIPKNASLLGQAVVGSSSAPGQGLLVNTWTGDMPDKKGKYMTTFTEFGCIPVSNSYQTDEYGWVVSNFFNNVIGIVDPSQLNLPDFCVDKVMKTDGEPLTFLSLFHNLP
ncbi:ependymin-2-like [Scomber japonicus]|uniref:ependymin-2-like n=1 Tax=Scomber japonicus TaxID=13676 RepID=UPI0023058C4C|nr:ependymin-2-like [Scomber japonicus]